MQEKICKCGHKVWYSTANPEITYEKTEANKDQVIDYRRHACNMEAKQ